jgi:hypothetical protein
MIARQLTPAEMVAECRSVGFRSGSGTGGYSNALIYAFNDLIGRGLVRRYRVYFLVPEEVRSIVAAESLESGQYWSPDDRGGLATSILHKHSTLQRPDVDVCVRFGPVEQLSGELFLLVREYELLLFGFIRAVLSLALGEERREWWRGGVPLEIRKVLAAESEERDLEEDYQALTLMHMKRILTSKPGMPLFVAATKVPSQGEFERNVNRVNALRNQLMHPVRGTGIDEESFGTVRSCLDELRRWVTSAELSQQLNPHWLPDSHTLLSEVELLA